MARYRNARRRNTLGCTTCSAGGLRGVGSAPPTIPWVAGGVALVAALLIFAAVRTAD
jgi:hypothetical protein